MTLTLCWSLTANARDSKVESLRIWSAPDHVRLVFDADSPIEHKLFTMKDPHRLVLDLKNTQLPENLPDPDKDNRFIRNLRSAKRGKTDTRVVLDLVRAVKPMSFILQPSHPYGHRLVVDLYDKAGESVSSKPTPVKSVDKLGHRDIVIAIDAGHGGDDPGAKGRSGTYEKDVVLAISRRLVKMINQQKGMKGVLIRDGDYYIGLRKRMEKAREHQADLFVSIHADAFRDPRVTGSSVYTLSRRGASSEAAKWLADRENSADLVGGVTLDGKDETLASVLLNLSQIGSSQVSNEAAEMVLKELSKLGKIHKRRVQNAGFMVLKSPDIPSMLVETAFISNPVEERRLRDPGYQTKLASAILSGISTYFEYQPPPGTWLAAKNSKRQATKHVIARGDTLSGIASQYQVSINELRDINALRNDVIQVGQVLEIPGG